MGNLCGRPEDPELEKQRISNLVKIQSLARSYLARKKKKEIKIQQMTNLFSK